MKLGGTLVEKVVQDPIIELQNVSPDGRWAVSQVALSNSETPRGVVAYSTQGGPALPICRFLCFVNWTMDGRFMYVHLPGTSQINDFGKTFIISRAAWQFLSAAPERWSGFRSRVGQSAGSEDGGRRRFPRTERVPLCIHQAERAPQPVSHSNSLKVTLRAVSQGGRISGRPVEAAALAFRFGPLRDHSRMVAKPELIAEA